MHFKDLINWFRFGLPAAGPLSVRAAGSYSAQDCEQIRNRLQIVFGPLEQLTVLELAGPAEDSPLALRIGRIPWRRLITAKSLTEPLRDDTQREVLAGRHDVYVGPIDHLFDEFKSGEIDIAIFADGLAAFPGQQALTVLHRLEKWAGLGAAIFTPVGPAPKDPKDATGVRSHPIMRETNDFTRLGYSVEVFEGYFGQSQPAVDAAWAIKRWGLRSALADSASRRRSVRGPSWSGA